MRLGAELHGEAGTVLAGDGGVVDGEGVGGGAGGREGGAGVDACVGAMEESVVGVCRDGDAGGGHGYEFGFGLGECAERREGMLWGLTERICEPVCCASANCMLASVSGETKGHINFGGARRLGGVRRMDSTNRASKRLGKRTAGVAGLNGLRAAWQMWRCVP